MQSDPTHDSPKNSSPNQYPNISSTTLQHGLQHLDAAAPVDPHGRFHQGTIAELSPDNGVGDAKPRLTGTGRYRDDDDDNSGRLTADGNHQNDRRIPYDESVDLELNAGDKVPHDAGLQTGHQTKGLHVTDLPNGMSSI
jgi:hypothetical protein